MKLIEGVCWGIIPARGGSKSIPLKNLAQLSGRPMIDYNVLAAKGCQDVVRLICSTDSEAIAERCAQLSVEVYERPAELAGDQTPVIDVITDLLEDFSRRGEAVGEFVALLQPTSPFVLPRHISQCVAALRTHSDAGSAQTVARCPHNYHAFNQRIVRDGVVDFRFAEERRKMYNKQTKPVHWTFGNLIVFRVTAAFQQKAVFPTPSRAIEIEWPYNLDVDGPADLRLAEALMPDIMQTFDHLSEAVAPPERPK